MLPARRPAGGVPGCWMKHGIFLFKEDFDQSKTDSQGKVKVSFNKIKKPYSFLKGQGINVKQYWQLATHKPCWVWGPIVLCPIFTDSLP